jgi:small subunit ribosomal protein S21
MLIIPVKDEENIEKALRKFKRKVEKTGVMRSLKSRKYFEKPSVVKKQQVSRAIHKQKKQAESEL